MKFSLILVAISCHFYFAGYAQTYPAFGNEIPVEITGLTFDAMEPFISPDGNTLFFNSLNSGGNTNLYFANRINDSTFSFQGLVNGCYDSSANHLDGVASADIFNNFFWVSMKGYPLFFENLHRGTYLTGNVYDTTRVYGDFNIPIIGWLIMDAFISNGGDTLIYCNSYFDFIYNSCGQGMPCEAKLGMAQKINDSTFNKMTTSDAVFSSINDTSYLVYAPHLSPNGLELYYTRLHKGTFNTEICAAVRYNNSQPFSQPVMIHSNYGFVPEAAAITTDMQKLYYHQKDNSGLFKIFLRYRNSLNNIAAKNSGNIFNINYNPVSESLVIDAVNYYGNYNVRIVNSSGITVFQKKNVITIDLSCYAKGNYIVSISIENRHQQTIIAIE